MGLPEVVHRTTVGLILTTLQSDGGGLASWQVKMVQPKEHGIPIWGFYYKRFEDRNVTLTLILAIPSPVVKPNFM
jgi:hypothetical protein